MKINLLKLLIILFVFCVFSQSSFAATKINYQELNAEYSKCVKARTSACFKNMLYKYNSVSEVKLAYAQALMQEKNYKDAVVQLDNIIKNERKNQKVIAKAKQMKEQINDLNATMKKASAKDTGDYYKELENTAKWERPLNLKVYIEDKSSKANILKNAFLVWDNGAKEIHFVFTGNKNDANITCKYVDSLNASEAGITKFTTYEVPNKGRFFSKADIEISRHQPNNGGLYTDKQLSTIVLHEIGHALGIISHSDNINDAMYYSTDTYRNATLSVRDINTIRRIYGKK